MIDSIQAFVQNVHYWVGIIIKPPLLLQWAASKIQKDGSQAGTFVPGEMRCNVLCTFFWLPKERTCKLFNQYTLNMDWFSCMIFDFDIWCLLCLMNCNVIDVIHWSAQRVWRMSPVEPAAVHAITVHLLGAHTVTSYLWMNLTAAVRGRESAFGH